jgi:hypothetical protein
MPEKTAFRLELRQEELLLVLMRMRLPLIPGIDRRLLDLPKEDLKELMDSAELTLLGRDLLRRDITGSLQLPPVLTAVLVTCTKPEKTILVSRTQPPAPAETVMVHVLVESIVLHTVMPSGKHAFVLFTEQNPVIEALLAHTGAKDFGKPDCPGGELTQDVYVQANRLAQSNDPGQLYALLSQHLPPDTTAGLHQVLVNLAGSVTLARLVHDGEKPEDTRQEGFNLIQGGGLQWLLRSTSSGGATAIAGEEKQVTFEGAALKDVRRELKKLFR